MVSKEAPVTFIPTWQRVNQEESFATLELEFVAGRPTGWLRYRESREADGRRREWNWVTGESRICPVPREELIVHPSRMQRLYQAFRKLLG